MSDEQRRQDLVLLEEFRADSVRFADEEWFKCLIADLQRVSPEFRACGRVTMYVAEAMRLKISIPIGGLPDVRAYHLAGAA